MAGMQHAPGHSTFAVLYLLYDSETVCVPHSVLRSLPRAVPDSCKPSQLLTSCADYASHALWTHAAPSLHTLLIQLVDEDSV
jgi:hypothetical protein